MAFSSSSNRPVFFSFFTRLFTAFSHHFSSCPFCSPPPAPPDPPADFFHPRSLFTTGGVNGKMDDIFLSKVTIHTQKQPGKSTLRAARSALASCRLASCSSTAARGSPASLPEPRAPPIRRRSPGLAPCRPLIGARGRPLGVRHAGRAGAHGRRREHGRDGRRPGAAGRAGGRAGRGQARAAASRLRPDRRHAQPISERGARGVSTASGAWNRKGNVAR